MIIYVKTDELFEEIRRISDESFDTFERAPRGILRTQFDTGTVFVIRSGVDSNRLLGYLILTRKFDESYVWAIAVDSVARGQGVGKTLLEEAACYVIENSLSQGIGLTVNTRNISAMRLYLKENYRVVKFLSGYYGMGGDGVVMRRKLL